MKARAFLEKAPVTPHRHPRDLPHFAPSDDGRRPPQTIEGCGGARTEGIKQWGQRVEGTGHVGRNPCTTTPVGSAQRAGAERGPERRCMLPSRLESARTHDTSWHSATETSRALRAHSGRLHRCQHVSPQSSANPAHMETRTRPLESEWSPLANQEPATAGRRHLHTRPSCTSPCCSGPHSAIAGESIPDECSWAIDPDRFTLRT